LIASQSARLRNGTNVLLLFFLGALLAAAAELQYGGWIQIPILSLIWWRMGHQLNLSIQNQFISGMSFGLGYLLSAYGGSTLACMTSAECMLRFLA
jgi:apolipoprotein N-acyltransferase